MAAADRVHVYEHGHVVCTCSVRTTVEDVVWIVDAVQITVNGHVVFCDCPWDMVPSPVDTMVRGDTSRTLAQCSSGRFPLHVEVRMRK